MPMCISPDGRGNIRVKADNQFVNWSHAALSLLEYKKKMLWGEGRFFGVEGLDKNGCVLDMSAVDIQLH